MKSKRPCANLRRATALSFLLAFTASCADAAGDNTAVLGRIQDQLDKDTPVAEKTFDELAGVLTTDPRNYTARLLLGTCFDKIGMPEQAQEQFDLATTYFPADPKAVIALVQANLKRGQPDAAMRLLDAASRRFPKEQILVFWSGNLGGEALYKVAKEKNRNLLGLPSFLGDKLLKKGRYGDAVRLADQDLDADREYWPAFRVKGCALLSLGNYGRAYQPLRIAFDKIPYTSLVAEKFARACIWAGRYEEAIEPALVDLALTATLESNNDAAKKALYAILSRVPKTRARAKILTCNDTIDKTFKNGAYHFALGDVLDHLGWNELAMNEYQSGLQENPGFARGIFRLGKDYEMQTRNYDEALTCYQKAHMLSPEDKEITAYLLRLQTRLPERKQDLAWRLKDWLRGSVQQ